MRTIRNTISLALFLALLAAVQAAPVRFEIPAQAAGSALIAFVKQAGVEVLFAYAELQRVQSTAVTGEFEPKVALDRLLTGTGFAAQRNSAGKFVVVRERAGAERAEIRGTVLRRGGGPVEGAIVRLAHEPRGVRTRTNGTFFLPDVPVSTEALIVQADGFVTMRVPGLALRPGARLNLGDVHMVPAEDRPEALAEIVVSAEELAGAIDGRVLYALRAMVVTPSRFGLEVDRGTVAATLTESDLLALPQLGEDLYRAISHLPGLTADDTTARFWVRGAPHDQLLARLDGVDLIEPFHLKDTDGSLSILDLETISRLGLFTGGFAAEYGDRSAGVLIMETDSHVRAAPRTTLGLSLTGGRAASRGRTADGRGRWLVSARSGFPDIAIKQAGEDAEGEIRPRYHDLMGKWEWQVSPANTFSFHALHSGDRMFFRDQDGPQLTSHYGSDYAWARWRGEVGGATGESVLSYADIAWDRDGSGFLDRRYLVDVHERRRLRTLGWRHDWSLQTDEWLLWRAGFESKASWANYDYHRARDFVVLRNGAFRTERLGSAARLTPNGRTYGAHLAGRVRLGESVVLEPGLRFDGNSHAGDRELTPRFSAAWQRGASTWRAAWGVYAQAQGLHELAVQDGDALFRPAERAEHRIVSFEHRLGASVTARLEGYERIVRRPRPHWDNAVGMLGALPEIDGDRVRLDPKRVHARGVELIVERRVARGVAASASYAYARSDETLQSGVTVPRARDQRHTLYLDVSYTPSPQWQFSAAWQYHTGWPTTAFEFSLVPLAGGGAAVINRLGPINALRLPAYQRLDLRVQRWFAVPRGQLRVFLDVFNVFGRKNIIDYNYTVDVRPGNRVEVQRRNGESLFPLLPSVGVTWDF